MNKLVSIISVLFFMLFFTCKDSESNSKSMNLGEMKMISEDQKSISETPNEITSERKLIKNGDVEFESKNLTETRKKIFKTIEKFKAYASSDNAYKNTSEISNSFTIRVPLENFDNLLNEIAIGVTKFDRKEITGPA